jgi:hypothetical protein
MLAVEEVLANGYALIVSYGVCRPDVRLPGFLRLREDR